MLAGIKFYDSLLFSNGLDFIARRDALNAASATRRAFDRHLTKVEQRGTHAQAKTAVQKGDLSRAVTYWRLYLAYEPDDLPTLIQYGLTLDNSDTSFGDRFEARTFGLMVERVVGVSSVDDAAEQHERRV